MSDKIDKTKLRKFGLTTLAVDNATSVFILTFMILLFGLQGYQDMPKEQFPDASFPTVFVNTPYFGNSASDIENLVTRPIEKELQAMVGIKDIQSTSMQDFSVITAEFNSDMDMDDVVRKVKDAVDKAKSELPDDLTSDPEVLEINTSEIPIMTVNISGEYNMDELRSFAEYLKDKIETVNEVSKAEIKGALEREIKINCDLSRMQALQITYDDIANAIRSENISMSGGELVNNDFRRAIRVIGEFDNVVEIENLIVKSENQRQIYLRDVASASYSYQDRSSISRMDGFPVISLDIIKRKGENLLAAAASIKEEVRLAKKNVFPEGLAVSLFNDQSINTERDVDNLENSIISGVILVVLVLMFFLGIRNSLFVGLAIPLSMLMGILILYITGVTLNIVVLFALILALGLLVDNGIVVVENIYRYMQEGYSGTDAAKYGAGEVALPIIASTATTLAAFLPLAFWPGIFGQFFKYLPITLIIVLSSSLFVALVINPVFTARFMKVDERVDDKKLRNRKIRNVLIGAVIMGLIAFAFHTQEVFWARNIFAFAAFIALLNIFFLRPASFFFQGKILPALERAYQKFVGFALYKVSPIFFLVGTIFLLIGSGFLISTSPPKTDFFPNTDPIYVNAFVELPMGKDIEATNRIMKDLEARVFEELEKSKSAVVSVLSQIGENTSDPNSPPEPGVTPNKGRLTIEFVPPEDRGTISTKKVMNDLRELLVGYPGVKIIVDQNAVGPPTGKPINIEITGDDINELAILSNELIKHVKTEGVEGYEELQADVKLGKPEMLVNINREAARRYELSTYSIANAIRTSVFGQEVSKFKVGEDEYPITVRLDPKYRNSVTQLLNQRVTFRNPANGRIVQVPISAVAEIDYNTTYSSIKRKNLKKMITVYSNVLEGYNANEVVADIKGAIENFKFPAGVTYSFTGEQQAQAEELAFLTSALLIAVFLIFIILVSQFNSIVSPFIIILSVVFSIIGVLLGYYFTGRNVVIVFTGIGVISLAGIVVNNAIVLVDYINLLIKNKRESLGISNMMRLTTHDVKKAIIKAGSTRLRPVLLTAITTVLGLIPLAMGININFFTLVTELDPQYFQGGDNAEFWGPMAWTVIYGLVFATFLTLVIVPVMYWLFYRVQRVVYYWRNPKTEEYVDTASTQVISE